MRAWKSWRTWRRSLVLRIRDSKPSDTGSRGHSDPMDVGCGQLSLVWQRKRVIESARWVFLGAVEHIFNETAMHARTQASNRLAKANSASHGPRVRPKAQRKTMHKGQSKESKGAKGSCTRAKRRKLVSQVVKTRYGGKLGHSGICTDMSH